MVCEPWASHKTYLNTNKLRGFDLPKSPLTPMTSMLRFLKIWRLYIDNKNFYKIDPRGPCPNNDSVVHRHDKMEIQIMAPD